jgi:class 3 adenylate cyclase
VRCQSCQHDNEDGNRFCGYCGAALTDPSGALDAVALPPTVGDGRYRTIRLLGEGSRKRVYLAQDSRLGRDVAVAVVKAERLDGNGRLRITREAQAMARLGEGPHIVTVFDVGEEADGTPFIVGQYMSGGSLDDLLAATPDRRLPVDRALEIAEQLALALAHAHSLGIVHRDIKPANVWMDTTGAARLGDFGLAADVDASRITSEGTVVGTVAYLAPEQALGREPDPRADLYALGALLYELLTGRPPFLGTDLVSVISQHLNTPPASVRFHNDAISERVDQLVLHLLEKDPDARPATADEVVAALRALSDETSTPGVPTNPPSESTARSSGALQADWGRFVGRTAELDVLHRAVDDALSGEMRLAMVVGEPGIGKTRTVEELGVYASLRGASVLWGHCYEGEIGVAYLPFVDALRTFVRDVSDDGTLLDPAAGGAEVATIVPDLRSRYPQIPVLPTLEGDAERHRLFEGIASFLEAATRIHPLVLVLDDLHWADKPTLLLLTHLARRLRHSRLVIVGTYRDVELERGHPLADTVATLRRERLYERVLLRGMSGDEVKAYIEAIGGQETPDQFAELIYRETEGNPFFVAEILRHLAETGAIRHEHGRWIGTPEDVARNLPEGVREVIGRRLDGLSDDCNAMLGVAAAMSGGFTIDVVGDVAGLSEDQILDALDEALAAQIVRERRDADATYEFNHALIRQTLYAELSTPRRVRMHRQVTEALEHRFADSIESHLPELAFHAYEAAPGGDVDKAVDYARRAGDQAMTRAAYEQAARSYGMAVQALELRSDADLSLQCDLALALARAHDLAGDIAARNAASEQAADLARRTGDVLRLASAALARAGSYWFTAVGRQEDYLVGLYLEAEQALRSLPPSTERDTLLALTLTRHSSTLVFLDAEESNARSQEAVEAARASGDPGALTGALTTRLSRTDDSADRQELLQDIAASARASGDLNVLQQSRISLLISAMYEHRRDEVDRQVRDYDEEAQRNRVPLQLASTLQHRGSGAAIDGRYGEAERLILESAALARRSGVPEVLANVGVALFPVYRELGRLREFESPTRRMVESSATMAAWNVGLALMLAESDEDEPMNEARSIVHTILADAESLLPDDAVRRYTIGMMIEVAAAAEDTDALLGLEPWVALEDSGSREAVLLGPVAYYGSWSRYVGLLDRALGRDDEAVAHLESAILCHETMRAPGWIARTRYDLAGTLLRRDAANDRERAAALLNQAVETANELGMSRLLEEALALKLALQGVPTETSLSASIDLISASVAVERPALRAHADPDGWVTLCFSDIVGYTQLTERLGDHRTHDLLLAHNELLRRELVAHKGVEVKSEGDGFMLAFRSSGDALGFAVSFQRGIAAHRWPDEVGTLRVRIGIHRGEVIRDDDDFFGRTVIIGARVAASAHGGEVLVTDDVRAVAGESHSFGATRHLSLKGLSGTYAASTLVW